MDIALKKHVSWELADTVNELASPLFNTLNFNLFSYGRYYDNGDFSVLYSDRSCTHAYLVDEARNAPGLIIDPGIHLWQDYIPASTLNFMGEQFDHSNGITLVTKYQGFKDHFTFASGRGGPSNAGTYLANQELIKQFKFYFLERAADLIKAMDADRFTSTATGNPQTLAQGNRADLQQLRLKKYHLQTSEGEAVLTAREFECFHYLLQLNTNKQIARKMNISDRTVEFHIKNLSKKLGCLNRSDFFEIATLNMLAC